MLSTVFTFSALLLATAVASPVLVSSRDVSTSGWAYQGCFTEATDERALIGKTYYNDFMTVEKCATACALYSYFGVEYGRECYCANTGLNYGSIAAPEEECNFPCPGNTSQHCGAGNRLNFYRKDATYTPTPTNTSPVPTPSSPSSAHTQIGCYTDSGADQRALFEANYYDDNLTVELCADLCGNEFTYFGLEYGRECWCGNTLRSSVSVSLDECNFPCAGNPNQKCGAGLRLSLYALTSSLPITSSSTTLIATQSPSPSPTTTSSSSTTTTTTTTTSIPESTCLASPVVNGGFEITNGVGFNDADNWMLSESERIGAIGPVTSSITTPHSGSSSYRIRAPILPTSNFHSIKQNFVDMKGLCVGRTYNFSAWIKVQHANLATPVTFEVGTVMYYYPLYVTPPMTPIASTEWFNFRGSFPVPDAQSASAFFVSLRFPPLTSTFAVYIDDVVLTMAPL